MHFLAVPAQDRFCQLISFLLHHLHEALSKQSQRSQFAEILNTCGGTVQTVEDFYC